MKDSGSVVIKGLRIYGHHGVMHQERVVGNVFELDIELTFSSYDSMRNDTLLNTINYAEVVGIAKRVMRSESSLLENVVGRLLSALRKQFPQITGGCIAIYKLQPPISAELDRVGFIYRW